MTDATLPSIAANRQPTKSGAIRYLDLDRGRGITILVTLFVHIIARNPPTGMEWHVALKHNVLEQTALPFFLYLSGIVGIRAVDRLRSLKDYFAYALGRAERLLIPFFSFGVIVIVGKTIAAHFIYVDNKPKGFWQSFLDLVWHTHESAALSVWFLYTLYLLCVIIPLTYYLLRKSISAMLVFFIGMYFVPMPEYFYLDRVFEYAPAFVFGCFVARRYERYVEILDRFAFVFVALFVAALATLSFGWDRTFVFLLISLTSLPLQHMIVRLPGFRDSNALLWLGKYTFVIYLLNTIFIGLAKGVMLKFLPWTSAGFLIIGPILYMSGMFGPVAVKRLVFSRVAILDRLTN